MLKARKSTQIGAEMYCQGRYFTVTGHVISEHSAIEDRQTEIDAVYKTLDERNEAAKGEKEKPARKKTVVKAPSSPPYLTDEVLIAKASATSGNAGAKFASFMNGDASGYASRSEADLAFCNLIVFWTDDADQVRRIVTESGLNRDKWNRDDYAEKTIAKALAGRKGRYDPRFHSNGQAHHKHNGQVCAADEAPPDPPVEGVSDAILDQAPPQDGPPVKDEPRDDEDIADPVCLTDVGNAKRFVKDHGAIVRFNHVWKKWLVWNGVCWRIDNTGRVMYFAKKTILGLFRWAETQIKGLAPENADDVSDEEAKIKSTN